MATIKKFVNIIYYQQYNLDLKESADILKVNKSTLHLWVVLDPRSYYAV